MKRGESHIYVFLLYTSAMLYGAGPLLYVASLASGAWADILVQLSSLLMIPVMFLSIVGLIIGVFMRWDWLIAISLASGLLIYSGTGSSVRVRVVTSEGSLILPCDHLAEVSGVPQRLVMLAKTTLWSNARIDYSIEIGETYVYGTKFLKLGPWWREVETINIANQRGDLRVFLIVYETWGEGQLAVIMTGKLAKVEENKVTCLDNHVYQSMDDTSRLYLAWGVLMMALGLASLWAHIRSNEVNESPKRWELLLISVSALIVSALLAM